MASFLPSPPLLGSPCACDYLESLDCQPIPLDFNVDKTHTATEQQITHREKELKKLFKYKNWLKVRWTIPLSGMGSIWSRQMVKTSKVCAEVSHFNPMQGFSWSGFPTEKKPKNCHETHVEWARMSKESNAHQLCPAQGHYTLRRGQFLEREQFIGDKHQINKPQSWTPRIVAGTVSQQWLQPSTRVGW